MVRSIGHPLRVIPTKTMPESLPLGERLRLPKQSAMNGFAEGEATAGQFLSIGSDGEHRGVNHRKVQRKAHCKSPS
jgi:hypothetical protein